MVNSINLTDWRIKLIVRQSKLEDKTMFITLFVILYASLLWGMLLFVVADVLNDLIDRAFPTYFCPEYLKIEKRPCFSKKFKPLF